MFSKSLLIAGLVLLSVQLSVSQCQTKTENKRFKQTIGLVNYWPLDDMSDVVGKKDILFCSNYTFTADRKSVPNSALRLNNGYCRLPEDYYLRSQYTVSAWIKPKTFSKYATILMLSNSVGEMLTYQALLFTFTNLDNFGPVMVNKWNNQDFIFLNSDGKLTPNVWQHVAFVLGDGIAQIFIDGALVASGQTDRNKIRAIGGKDLPQDVVRSNNFIGKAIVEHPDYQNAAMDLDELKLFSRALTSNEIKAEMNNNKY
jgi:hypothetical protein